MKKKSILLAAVLLTALFALAAPRNAFAAEDGASLTGLKIDKQYNKYDITGDGKADKFKLITHKDKYGDYDSYRVRINGKNALQVKNVRILSFHDSRLIRLANGQVYLAIFPGIENGDDVDAAIYQYKDGELKKVLGLYTMDKIGFHCSVDVKSVSGNTITLDYYVMSLTLGGIGFDMDYKYDKGSLVQSTTKMDFESILDPKPKYWTANVKLQLVKSPTDSTKVTTLKKGKKAEIDKIYINKKHTGMYIHVKIKDGKSGWVKGYLSGPQNIEKNKYFKEVMYAG